MFSPLFKVTRYSSCSSCNKCMFCSTSNGSVSCPKTFCNKSLISCSSCSVLFKETRSSFISSAANKFECKRKSCNSLDTLGNFFCKELRSEEHTSELQSRGHLVCRLLLEKKKR